MSILFEHSKLGQLSISYSGGILGICRAQSSVFRLKIADFTGNCGIKAVSHFYSSINSPVLIPVAEWAIFYRSIQLGISHYSLTMLVGSDRVGGVTYTCLKNIPGWKFSEPIHNRAEPYKDQPNHLIVTFEKRWTDFDGDDSGPSFTRSSN